MRAPEPGNQSAEFIPPVRPAGCASVEEVGVAVLENNGQISVLPRRGRREP